MRVSLQIRTRQWLALGGALPPEFHYPALVPADVGGRRGSQLLARELPMPWAAAAARSLPDSCLWPALQLRHRERPGCLLVRLGLLDCSPETLLLLSKLLGPNI